jgi:cardiolipin synthase
MVRVVLTPFIADGILHGRPLAAFWLAMIAGFTDVIDGGLARRLGASSAAGAYFDPIADKVLLSTIYICLALRGVIPWWFVAIVFGRDVLILAAAGVALSFTTLRKFPPSVWGKLSTFFQILAAVVWMGRDAFPAAGAGLPGTGLAGLTLDSIGHLLIWISTAATAWSGVHYTWRGIQMLRTD